MKIILSPRRQDEFLEVVREGDTLIINGEVFDFSLLGEGDTLPAGAINSPWFWDKVERISGELELTLFLPLPVNYSQEQAFPEPIYLSGDGPVELPKPLPELLQSLEVEVNE